MKGSKGSRLRFCKSLAFAGLSLFSSGSWAGWYNDGKVLLTGGVFTVDGAGGGGAVPWATITGYETRDGINGGVGFTYASLPALDLNVFGGAVGFFDRFELSYAQHDLSLDLPVLDTLALVSSLLGDSLDIGGTDPWNSTLKMDVYGAKLRLFGDAVYTSDSFIPQTAIGFLYKENTTEDLVRTLGAADNKDWEAYVAFTKVFFRYSTLVNLNARYTSANEIGLTGFGVCNGAGAALECDNDKEFRFEASVAHLLQKNFAIGAEYQQHGDNLDGRSVNLGEVPLTAVADLLGSIPLLSGGVLGDVVDLTGLSEALKQNEESDWYDFFFAYAPSKNYSITIAYLWLGNISVAKDQNGLYLSLHATF